MFSRNILVHFQGQEDWCVIVQTPNFGNIFVFEIASIALNRYNSVHHEMYDLRSSTIEVINSFNDESITIVDNPITFKIKNENDEVIVILPTKNGHHQNNLKMSVSKHLHYKNQGLLFLRQHNFAAASECFKILKNVIYSPDEKIITKLKSIKGLSEIGYNIKSQQSKSMNVVKLQNPMIIKGKNLTIIDYIQQCSIPGINIKLVKAYITVISKVYPATALEIALSKPELHKFLSKLCNNEKLLELLPVKIHELGIQLDHLTNFFDSFFERGKLTNILSFLKQLRENYGHGNRQITLYYSYFLLLDRQLKQLNLVLLDFFKANKNLEFCSIYFESFYQFLEKSIRNNAKSHSFSASKFGFDSFEMDILKLLIVMNLSLYIEGKLEYFNQLAKLIEPIFFYKSKFNISHNDPIISLYLACYSSSYQISSIPIKHEKNKVFIIGDECAAFCSNRKYDDIGGVDCHLLADLSIAILRNENDSPIKSAFWNRIHEGASYKTIVLVLGNIDFRTTIPIILSREFDASFNSIYERLVNIYLTIIDKIHQVCPNTSLIIHAVFDFFPSNRKLIRQFNDYLKGKIQSYATFYEMNHIEINSLKPEECPPKEYYNNFRDALYHSLK